MIINMQKNLVPKEEQSSSAKTNHSHNKDD